MAPIENRTAKRQALANLEGALRLAQSITEQEQPGMMPTKIVLIAEIKNAIAYVNQMEN